MTDDYREIADEDFDRENPFGECFEVEITDSIDLHAFAPRDVSRVVRSYLDEAHRKGFRLVRIIHGKGIGVQRESVRKILSETEFVKSFKNAPELNRHQGATVVELE